MTDTRGSRITTEMIREQAARHAEGYQEMIEFQAKRIRELEAALSTAYGNLCNGLKVPAMGTLEKALGLIVEEK